MSRSDYIPCGLWDVIQATKKAVMLKGDDGDWIWVPRSVIKDGDELARGQKSYVWARQWWVEKEQLIFEEASDCYDCEQR